MPWLDKTVDGSFSGLGLIEIRACEIRTCEIDRRRDPWPWATTEGPMAGLGWLVGPM